MDFFRNINLNFIHGIIALILAIDLIWAQDIWKIMATDPTLIQTPNYPQNSEGQGIWNHLSPSTLPTMNQPMRVHTSTTVKSTTKHAHSDAGKKMGHAHGGKMKMMMMHSKCKSKMKM